MNKAINIALIAALSLIIIPIAIAVIQIITPPSGYVFVIDEDVPFNYNITGSGSPTPLGFNDTSQQVGFSCFQRMPLNDTAQLINFTATNDCVGNWTFLRH